MNIYTIADLSKKTGLPRHKLDYAIRIGVLTPPTFKFGNRFYYRDGEEFGTAQQQCGMLPKRSCDK